MNGFTLVESLIVLGCIALLAVLAISNNRVWFIQQSSQGIVDQLVRDLQFARQQAIIRGSTITLCSTLTGETCAQISDWSWGYLIFVDHPNELLVTRTLNTKGTLSNSRHTIQFAPTGFTPSHNSTFLYTLETIERRVIISLQGRIRVE